ncbi:hypothetical protein GCM10020358_56620 [Amorphoplanes nipponensis]|uniref:ARB-07466-like C-terminal domain-containing protein n=1 Tax=Actinoplanes nipponensis TaxID=135950 RepID=A0A919MRQ7_9ACTN|nr:hypothetical protein [Actinoplanes nipponensis]GIE51843.1 hypothetical protein Ani05nite_53770 [Actinoplanes nipponensis]
MRLNPVRRRLATALAVLVATSGLALAAPQPASAAPRPLAAPGDSGDDGEGGSQTLIKQLEAASKGFVEAKEALDRSKKRQQELTAKLKQIDTELGPRQAALDDIVGKSYRTGRLGAMTALITADSTRSMLDRAQTLETIAVKQDRALRDLKDSKAKQEQAKAAIDAAISDQQRQLTVMAKRKSQAENALKVANAANGSSGSSSDDGGSTGGGGSSSLAAPAPRNSDGSLPSESCSVNDPTTSGCITPRTLHAMQEAKKDGFNHFIACFRHQNSGEHPKGRACDWAADKGGFGGDATGASKDYGNRLANYFIANASRLGVLYVIWYRRIWLPSSGWKSYSGAGGDPSSDHTNHVHLSMR